MKIIVKYSNQRKPIENVENLSFEEIQKRIKQEFRLAQNTAITLKLGSTAIELAGNQQLAVAGVTSGDIIHVEVDESMDTSSSEAVPQASGPSQLPSSVSEAPKQLVASSSGSAGPSEATQASSSFSQKPTEAPGPSRVVEKRKSGKSMGNSDDEEMLPSEPSSESFEFTFEGLKVLINKFLVDELKFEFQNEHTIASNPSKIIYHAFYKSPYNPWTSFSLNLQFFSSKSEASATISSDFSSEDKNHQLDQVYLHQNDYVKVANNYLKTIKDFVKPPPTLIGVFCHKQIDYTETLFGFLKAEDLLKLCSINRQFYNHSKSEKFDNVIWKKKARVIDNSSNLESTNYRQHIINHLFMKQEERREAARLDAIVRDQRQRMLRDEPRGPQHPVFHPGMEPFDPLRVRQPQVIYPWDDWDNRHRTGEVLPNHPRRADPSQPRIFPRPGHPDFAPDPNNPDPDMPQGPNLGNRPNRGGPGFGGGFFGNGGQNNWFG